MAAARKAAIIILILLLAVCLLLGQTVQATGKPLPGQIGLFILFINPCTFHHRSGALFVGGAVEGLTPAELNIINTMNTSKISGYWYNVKKIRIQDLRATYVYGWAGVLPQAKPRPDFFCDTNTNKNNLEISQYYPVLTINGLNHGNILLSLFDFCEKSGRERWRRPLPVSFPCFIPFVDNKLFDTLEIRQTEIFIWISGLIVTVKGWQGWNALLDVSFIDTTVSKEAGAFSILVAPGLNRLYSLFKVPSLNINTPGPVCQAEETCMVKEVDRPGSFQDQRG